MSEDKILTTLVTDNADLFSTKLDPEIMKNLILLDLGFSSKFKVLCNDGPDMLSQSWVFCGGEKGFSAQFVSILSGRRVDLKLTLTNLTSPIVQDRLESRLKNPYWKQLQVLRQLKVDLYRCTKEGNFLIIDHRDGFPRKATPKQLEALAQCSHEPEGWMEGESELSRDVSQTSLDSNLAALIRTCSEEVTGERRPNCAVTREKQAFFVVNGKQIYSWEALYKHVLNNADQKSDEVVVYEDEGECYLAHLQCDMFREFLHKSEDFDFHCKMSDPTPRRMISLGALLHAINGVPGP
jgi:hypothetical protein